MAEILVIGGGGREHAIAAALSTSPLVHNIYACPGNAGTKRTNFVQNRPLDFKDHTEVVKCCHDWGVSLVVIGPEDPLAEGLADSLHEAGIKVFGPSKAAARIESSKAWAKEFMKRHSIPTAQFEAFTNLKEAQDFIDKCQWEGFAIKASGLAGGKGVAVVDDHIGAKQVVKAFVDNQSDKIKAASETTVIEEKLVGFEVSVLAFTDGKTISVMPPAQDHKQRYGGGLGPNTGGMGAYCPCPLVSDEDLKFIEKNIIQKTVDEMRNEGCPYVGVLYAGIMMTGDGPKVLEFNCRFGDPETEALLPLLEADLYSVMMACASGTLHEISPVKFVSDSFSVAVTVVVGNYPDDVKKGMNYRIEGMEEVTKNPKTLIFMAGVKEDESGMFMTSGGRVLHVCSTGKSLEEALGYALRGAAKISFKNAPLGYETDFRGDIGLQAIKRIRQGRSSKLSYQEAGVNIDVGNLFVKKIKKFSEQTRRSGDLSELGMFGAVFDLKREGYKDPLLISGTDGVGTKLKIAIEQDYHKTIGQDLVAMCVNDILVHAAEPLFFLDYLACGKLESEPKAQIIEGIANACCNAKCSLVGGETAEMPGMYSENDYDLAGFVVGAVETGKILPRMDQMSAGNVLIGVASSGIHSNGFSLVRKVIEKSDLKFSDPAPFNPKETLGNELLKPTHIYTFLLDLLRNDLVLGAAHITGGGIEENLLRVIPEFLGVNIYKLWNIPSVFAWLAAEGISTQEMLRTFNLGLGMILVVEENNVDAVMEFVQKTFKRVVSPEALATYPQSRFRTESSKQSCWVIGSLVDKEEKGRFSIRGIDEALNQSMGIIQDSCPNFLTFLPRRRVAVLISGSGTNLQALLDHTMSGPSRAEIVLVISNIPNVQGLVRASKANVHTEVVPHKNYSSREAFEDEIHAILTKHDVELICLAGFMRILTSKFVVKWKGKLLNIHPSLLPSFKGKDAQKQSLETGVCVSGCTVHFVSEEVDAGAIIAQESVPVLPNDDVESLSERIKKAEHKAYPKALELVARGKIYLEKGEKRQIRS